VYTLKANWASNWGVVKAGIVVSWLRGIMYFFEEVIDCLLKLFFAQGLLKI
jgi:hypothetical protein